MNHPLIEPLEARIAPATFSIAAPAGPFTEGDSGTKEMIFTVTLTGAITSEATVHFATADGPLLPVNTAARISDNDYVATSGTLIFQPGETEQLVRVVINGDGKREQDERLFVRLDTPTGEGTLGTASATGTITNDDPVPTVTITAATLVEGNAGESNMEFTLTLSNPVGTSVAVLAVTADGTAKAGEDYVAVIDDPNVPPVVFAAGTTSAKLTVKIKGDTTFEPTERFFVNLLQDSPRTTGVIVGTPQVEGTITNDDPPPAANVRVDDVQVVEGNSGMTKQAVFTVTLSSGPLVGNVTVQAATGGGTATAGTDYTAVAATTLTFQPGETTKQIFVPILGDAVVEPSETFFLNLSDISTNAVISRAQGTGSIVADDAALQVSDVQIFEGGSGGTAQAVFTVTLENPPATGDVTVKVNTANGTATAGTDYTAVADRTLTFRPGQPSIEVFVPIIGDSIAEANKTFLVNLTEPSVNAAIGRGTATGTILNDDGVVFSINDVAVTEGNSGSTNAIFLVRLVNPQASPVSVDVTTVPGTASTADFTFTPATQTLTFAANETQKLVAIAIVGDLIRESAETFVVRLSNAPVGATFAKDAGIGTILDDNDPVPTLSLGNGTLVEGNSGTSLMQFTATLSQPASDTVTATFSTRDLPTAAHPALAGADYTAVADGLVTFTPGQTSVLISVPILGDTVNESDETFGVRLSAPNGAVLGTADAVGTIRNDEVMVSIAPRSQAEGNGELTTYFFDVQLTAPGSVVTEAVIVNFETRDGTAISTGASKDFTAANGALTFQPGGNLVQQIAIAVAGDSRLENDEQFFVNLVASVNAAISVAQGVGTIQNDDQARISIEDPAAFTEGNSATGAMAFTVKLENPSDLPVTFLVNTVNGTALATVDATTLNDFTGIVDRSVTFAAGELEKIVTVNVVGDTVDELKTETFSVEIKPATPVQNGVVIDRATASGAIIDNDLRTLSVTDRSVIEGNAGTTTITFTVRLSSASTQDAGVSFFYSTQDSTATAGQDYVGIAALQATIPKGQTSVPVSVTVNGDTTSEVNEQFKLMIFGSLNAEIVEGADSATATIVDDEAGGARLELVALAGTSFGEADGFVEFDVIRSGSTARAASVQYETVDGTARSTGTGITDFVANSGTISFAAGSNTASDRIRIRIIGDINFENDETFQVRLFNPVNAAVISGGDAAVESSTAVTIQDDGDQAPTLSVADVSIVEGNAGTQQQLIFKVRLSATNEKAVVTVKAATAAGADAATNANPTAGLPNQLQDYLPGAASGVTLTFATGDLEKDFAVTVNGDARDESDEEFFRVLLSGESGAAISRAEAKGTIEDNDAAPTLTFSSTGLQTTEGNGGQTNAAFKVTLSEVSERPVSVRVTTQAGTAVLGADFEAVNAVFFYTPGAAASDGIAFTVPLNADLLDEVDETFGVTVGNAEFGQLRQGTANVDSVNLTATIVDDDAPPVVFVNDTNIVEGDDGIREMIFTAALSAASGKTVDVNFATEDGTAFSVGPMADFVAKTGALKFAPGETQQEVRVVINGDTFREQVEAFALRISNPVDATILTATGTGTILTDGDATVGIGIRNAFRVEGDSGQSTINFTVELSDTLAAATTFNAASTSGSATRGSDFVPLGIAPFTIAAGAKTTTIPVTLNGDGTFEATESFFVELRNIVNAGETLTVANDAARGTIFNDDLRRVDARTVQFIDVDGDLATVQISTGILAPGDPTQGRLSFGPVNSIGGRQLQLINLTGDNLQFQDADLSVTAVAQPGFNGDASGVKGNGFVNVGSIAAATQAGVLQFANGIDLGTVNIDGDLGRIHIGDSSVDAAIKQLVVRSMGRFGTTTQGAGGGADTLSRVLGPIDSFRVYGNFQATMQIVGVQFGIIRNLQIDGALLGGTADNSGSIFFTGRIDNAQIGRIAGGDGDVSGSLRSLLNANSRISNLRVAGDIAGGAGENSGNVVAPDIGSVRIGGLVGGDGASTAQIFANTISRVVVARDVVGGTGDSSGQIFGSDLLGTVRILGQIRGGDGDNSAFVASNERIGTIMTAGSVLGGVGSGSGSIVSGGPIADVRTGTLLGGDGDNSGTIRSGGHVQVLNVDGNVRGGLGNRSGGVDVGGKLFNGVIAGSIIGGDANVSDALVGSGFLFAHRIDRLTVGGNVEAGADGGGGLALSGTIRSETTIDTLRIRGNVIGSATIAAIIAAPGDTSAPAFRSLIIDGDARFAEILAGYSVNATAGDPRGGAVNADAQIGGVRIGGDYASTSIIAGVAAGTDGVFGTNDDLGISGAGTANAAGTVSKIARIIVGSVSAASPTTRLSGIGAQFLESLTVNGSAFSLEPGSGNDLRGELAPGSRVNVFELPVV